MSHNQYIRTNCSCKNNKRYLKLKSSIKDLKKNIIDKNKSNKK